MFSCRAPLTKHASLLGGAECAALCFVLLPFRSRTLNFVTKRSGVSSGSMEFSPLIYLFKNLYREETRAALTDVKNIGERDYSI
jgi:hypothetical protein